MAGDLEDFLRRAAERRQAKAAQQQAAPKRSPRPEYSNRRTERVVQAVEEPITAEVVDDHSLHLAERRRRIEEARKLAAQVEAEAVSGLKKSGRKITPSRATKAAPILTGNTSDDLIRLLKSPGGLRQAILLREIFDRPEHRW